jgi:hypothetical protein
MGKKKSLLFFSCSTSSSFLPKLKVIRKLEIFSFTNTYNETTGIYSRRKVETSSLRRYPGL